MVYNNYVNQLNQLNNQENKSELENFYSFNAGLLQFFKGIDGQITAILNASTINPKSVELIQSQVNAVLSTLNKLKFEISMFDTATLSEAHKAKITQTIAYVQNNMTISEVDIVSNQLFDLLKKNETAFANEQKERNRQEMAEKEVREQREKAERDRAAREEAEYNARKERERKEREETERREKEARERIEREAKIKSYSLDFLCNFIGKDIDSNEIKQFIHDLNELPHIEHEYDWNRCNYCFFDNGIDFITEHNIITDIYLCNHNASGIYDRGRGFDKHKAFIGNLPFDISFNDSIDIVERKTNKDYFGNNSIAFYGNYNNYIKLDMCIQFYENIAKYQPNAVRQVWVHLKYEFNPFSFKV